MNKVIAMPSDKEYEAMISGYDYNAILELWKQIKAKNTPGWDEGKAFEYMLLRAFQLEGAEVQWPYRIYFHGEQIEQIDGAVFLPDICCLLGAKDRDDLTTIESIAKMRSQLLRRHPSAFGVLFSRSGFTSPAKSLTHVHAPQLILLWHGEEVEVALNHMMVPSLRRKYRRAITHAIHDYSILGP